MAIRREVDVQSSNIAKLGYDPATKIMEVVFKTGGRYRYFNVTPTAYCELLNAESIGSLFSATYRKWATQEKVSDASDVETPKDRPKTKSVEAGKFKVPTKGLPGMDPKDFKTAADATYERMTPKAKKP